MFAGAFTSVHVHNPGRIVAVAASKRRMESQLGSLDPRILVQFFAFGRDCDPVQGIDTGVRANPEASAKDRCWRIHWLRSANIATCSLLAISCPLYACFGKSNDAGFDDSLHGSVRWNEEMARESRNHAASESCHAGLWSSVPFSDSVSGVQRNFLATTWPLSSRIHCGASCHKVCIECGDCSCFEWNSSCEWR